ncbi:MAG: transposase [Usitatibacter sp.]
MSRLPRHFVPGLPAHLVHRGNNRGEIFRCESDFLFFRHCLQDRARFGVTIHSYVFMPNHYHLLATPLFEDSLSKFIQSVARRYVGYFNSRYLRSGTLWEGRYHASLIRDDRYLLACHRYIDMNPVRAGLTPRPGDYPWSSHRHYAGGEPDSLIESHPLIGSLSLDETRRQASYLRLFSSAQDELELVEMRAAIQKSRPTGQPEARKMGRPRKSRV